VAQVDNKDMLNCYYTHSAVQDELQVAISLEKQHSILTAYHMHVCKLESLAECEMPPILHFTTDEKSR